MKSILTLAAVFAVAHHASAEYFADQVVSFTPGSGQTSYLNPGSALGKPSPITSAPPPWDPVFSLYNSHYDDTELVQVAPGGSLTLRLSSHVRIVPGAPEIGVFENVFFVEGSGGLIGGSFGADSALVEVSQDGKTWYSLNSGQPILFGMAATYFLNSVPSDARIPDNPIYADFGKPFLGQPADFTGKTYSQALDMLDGSAGGTWLDLDEVPLSEVGYIRFTGSGTDTLEINAISINSAAAVPEPSVALALAGGVAFLGLIRRRRS